MKAKTTRLLEMLRSQTWTRDYKAGVVILNRMVGVVEKAQKFQRAYHRHPLSKSITLGDRQNTAMIEVVRAARNLTHEP